MSIVIRAGEESDATLLAELAARTFHETFAADNRPEDMALHMARAYSPSQQQRELADPAITTLLAEVEGQLAGYAQLRAGVAPDSVSGESPVELWRFYVASSWHGRGVAQALMRRVDVEAYRRGGRTLWLGVWERNARAMAFYLKTGFQDVGSHLFMVGTDPQTDRILARQLTRRPGTFRWSTGAVSCTSLTGARLCVPHPGRGSAVMRLDVYVNYRGNCEQAFRFYEQHLGGRITGIVRHGEQPDSAVPADWKGKVLHARIEIGSTVIMGADIPHAEPMRSAYLALSLDREEDAERAYVLLTEGGEIFMRIEKTPFANRFAMLRDRFGTSWMLLHQPEAP